MDYIEVKAKTIDDAITDALVQLGITSDKLDYEVIEKGNSGFLGIFNSKPAKIKAREKQEEERNHKISMLVPGSIVEGVVESIMPYGAFIGLGNGLNGLVHISQICQKRISSPNEVLKEGQKVKAKILNTNDHKISLSMKALEEEMVDTEDAGEVEEYISEESASTSLGSLLSNLKLS